MKTQIVEYLRGKKTILVAAIAAIYYVGVQHSWWAHDSTVDGFLGFAGIASLRAALQQLITAAEILVGFTDLNDESSPTASTPPASPANPNTPSTP